MKNRDGEHIALNLEFSPMLHIFRSLSFFPFLSISHQLSEVQIFRIFIYVFFFTVDPFSTALGHSIASVLGWVFPVNFY
jgi:hypothetical protein